MELAGQNKCKRFEYTHKPRAENLDIKRLITMSRMCVEDKGGGIDSVRAKSVYQNNGAMN